ARDRARGGRAPPSRGPPTRVCSFGRPRATSRSASVSSVSARQPRRPRIRPLRVIVAWVISSLALLFAAAVVPGVAIEGWWSAVLAAAVLATLNAILPPVLAALRLPYALVVGLFLVLALDAAMFMLAARITPSVIAVDSFGA